MSNVEPTASLPKATPPGAQQAVAELLVVPLTNSVPMQLLREHHLLPC